MRHLADLKCASSNCLFRSRFPLSFHLAKTNFAHESESKDADVCSSMLTYEEIPAFVSTCNEQCYTQHPLCSLYISLSPLSPRPNGVS